MRYIRVPGMIGLVALVLSMAVACVQVDEPDSIPPVTPSLGDGGGADPAGGGAPVPQDPVSKIQNEADAARFLSRATFGGTKAEIAALNGNDAADWIQSELSKPYTLMFPILDAQPTEPNGRPYDGRIDELYWDQIVGADDQLRQRMVFALSQILVYSDAVNNDQRQRAVYQDILTRNAFGNYRELLEEVTYSPAMGEWLTYLNNRKADPGRQRINEQFFLSPT